MALSLRATDHSRPHTHAGNTAFPRIVDNQVLSETRNIAQVVVVITCSSRICGAAFRVRNSNMDPTVDYCSMNDLTRDGQATAAGAYALSVTANEGESKNQSHSPAV
jgi:hypothetical protein